MTEINGVRVGCFRITFSLNLYNVGVKYTSASVASATTNSVPVFTFFFAVLFRCVTCSSNHTIRLYIEEITSMQ